MSSLEDAKMPSERAAWSPKHLLNSLLHLSLLGLSLFTPLLNRLTRLFQIVFKSEAKSINPQLSNESVVSPCNSPENLSGSEPLFQPQPVSPIVENVKDVENVEDVEDGSTSTSSDHSFNWEPFDISKDPLFRSASLEISTSLIETPDATLNTTMESTLVHSFELNNSYLDEAMSDSVFDALIAVPVVPCQHMSPRTHSLIPPRYLGNPCARELPSVKRQRKNLRLRHQPHSLTLDNLTGLMIAAWDNDPAQVKRLLESGQSSLQAEHGYSALMLAVKNQSADAVPLLAASEAGLQDSWGNTALIHAILLGRLDIAERLIQHDAGKQDNEGRTALIISAYCGHRRLISKLSIEIGLSGFTKLMYLAAQGQTDELSQHLDLAGQQDIFGRTALMYASINGYFYVAQVLASYESGVQANWGGTALMYATLYGHFEIVQLLIPLEEKFMDVFSRTARDHALNPMHSDLNTRKRVLNLLNS